MDQTLTIKTSKPEPTLLNDLCDPLMAVYDSESPIDEELGASCTGPFIATSFEAMTEVQMKKMKITGVENRSWILLT